MNNSININITKWTTLISSIVIAIILDEFFYINGWFEWIKKIGLFSFIPSVCILILDRYRHPSFSMKSS